MVVIRLEAIALLSVLPALLLAAPARADDAPVERPAVGHPALPQSTQEAAPPVEHPATAHPATAHPTAARTATERRATERSATVESAPPDRHRTFLYLGPGVGVLSGLSGGADYERTNPAFTGLLGVELPLGRATGLGFELDADLELAGNDDRGSYEAIQFRMRLSQMLAPNTRLWGALGVGRAGYQSGSLVGSVAAGTTLLLAPRFGLDFSANLNVLGSANEARVNRAGVIDNYDGGVVLFLALRAMFEFHRGR